MTEPNKINPCFYIVPNDTLVLDPPLTTAVRYGQRPDETVAHVRIYPVVPLEKTRRTSMTYDIDELERLVNSRNPGQRFAGLWDARKALPAMLADLRAMREMLKRLEFGTHTTSGWGSACPICGRSRREGHAADCALAKLIGGGDNGL